MHLAAFGVPLAARTANSPSVEHLSLRCSKVACRKRIIGVNIGDFVHRPRAAVCIKGHSVSELLECHRADDFDMQEFSGLPIDAETKIEISGTKSIGM